ncbi:hypothetical protein GCM10023198_41970 [Promicromonospora umidemergens]|uniref:Uncharacterized protein n=1 Tax=Promicromonospora umidemergens TaxID=629679 RepID=A0ABP8XUV5_9MICO
MHSGERGADTRRFKRDTSDMRGGGKLPPPRDLQICPGIRQRPSEAQTSPQDNPDINGGANLAPPRDLRGLVRDQQNARRRAP